MRNNRIQKDNDQPKKIEVRGARVHNLKNIDVDVPLHGITAIAGVSGYCAPRLRRLQLYPQ